MAKIRVEVCLISARGLRRTSSLWKLQWFAVGWVDPGSKYCTKVDASGNVNPVWKTKFSTTIDPSESNFQEMALHVEVYSREPIFLRESLFGTTTVVLKEFLDKYGSSSKPVEEVGSFQLRKKNSNKPLGFVDVSIRVSEDREDPGSLYLGPDEGFNLTGGANNGSTNPAAGRYGSMESFRPHLPERGHPMPFPTNYTHHPPVGRANYPAANGPTLPPPPPSHANIFPMTSSYIDMPASVAPPGRGLGPAFGMGVGAGALAAGAVIFGDDFMSGNASATISARLPF